MAHRLGEVADALLEGGGAAISGVDGANDEAAARRLDDDAGTGRPAQRAADLGGDLQAAFAIELQFQIGLLWVQFTAEDAEGAEREGKCKIQS